MKSSFIAVSLASLLTLTSAVFAQPAASTEKMGSAKPIGVSASTAADAQQKAASDAGNVGSVVRTSEGPETKAARAKNSAMDHAKKSASTDRSGIAASGAPMSK